MNNIKLTAVARNTDEPITFSPQDIMTLYVGGEFNTFVNVDTVEAVNVETPITEENLKKIGFWWHGYTENPKMFYHRIFGINDLVIYLRYDDSCEVRVNSSDKVLYVSSIEQLIAITDSIYGDKMIQFYLEQEKIAKGELR